jgi:hypothetical protein
MSETKFGYGTCNGINHAHARNCVGNNNIQVRHNTGSGKVQVHCAQHEMYGITIEDFYEAWRDYARVSSLIISRQHINKEKERIAMMSRCSCVTSSRITILQL